MALLGLGVHFLGGDYNFFGTMAAYIFVLLLIPVVCIYRCPEGWRRWTMSAYVLGMLAIAGFGLYLFFGPGLVDNADITKRFFWARDALLWGSVISSWVGQILARG
jgi:hypothetical protein